MLHPAFKINGPTLPTTGLVTVSPNPWIYNQNAHYLHKLKPFRTTDEQQNQGPSFQIRQIYSSPSLLQFFFFSSDRLPSVSGSCSLWSRTSKWTRRRWWSCTQRSCSCLGTRRAWTPLGTTRTKASRSGALSRRSEEAYCEVVSRNGDFISSWAVTLTHFPPVIPPQIVPGDGQENGQTNEEEEAEKPEKDKQRRTSRDKRKNSVSEEASETQTSVNLDGEAKKGKPTSLKSTWVFLIAVDYWLKISSIIPLAVLHLSLSWLQTFLLSFSHP